MRTDCHKESHYVLCLNVGCGWGAINVNKYNYKQYKYILYILYINKNDTQKFVSSY